MKRIVPNFAWVGLLLLGLMLPSMGQPSPPEPPSRQESDSPARPEQGENGALENRSASRKRPHPQQSFGIDFVVRTNETVGDLVLFGGSADIQGTVEGDLVMIGGSAKISGEVTRGVVLVGGGLDLSGTIGRDAVVVLGGADLADSAKIEGNGVLIGGPFKVSNQAQIFGERQMIPLGDVLPKILWFKKWLVEGLLWGRLLPFSVAWPWVVAGFILMFYFLVLVLFPAGVKASYLALEKRPIASFAAGLLAVILSAPLAIILAITVVGIAAIPFVKIALLLAMIVGKIGVICFLGRSVGRASGGVIQSALPAFLVGAILLTLVYAVPVVGLPAWGLATVFGLGAALVALGDSFSREQAEVAPVNVPLATVRPATTAASTNPASAETPVAPSQVALGFQAQSAQPNLAPGDALLLRRAGFWHRFLASLLDFFLLFILLVVIGPFGVPLLVPFAIVYFVAMWTWKGTTLGSIVLGLKVIRTDGRPVSFSVALVRSLASIFSGLVLFLGFLWIIWDKEKQGWHDKIAGTTVVRMPKDFALISLF